LYVEKYLPLFSLVTLPELIQKDQKDHKDTKSTKNFYALCVFVVFLCPFWDKAISRTDKKLFIANNHYQD